jgi:hypothetical protein
MFFHRRARSRGAARVVARARVGAIAASRFFARRLPLARSSGARARDRRPSRAARGRFRQTTVFRRSPPEGFRRRRDSSSPAALRRAAQRDDGRGDGSRARRIGRGKNKIIARERARERARDATRRDATREDEGRETANARANR